MLEQDITYSIESEIDKAFPYLDKLDEELHQLKSIIEKKNILKQSPVDKQKNKFTFFNIFLIKNEKGDITNNIDKPIKLRKKTLKHQNYSKDGYEFRMQLVQKFDDVSVRFYEFSVDITFDSDVKKEQFYKKFDDVSKAKQYYSNMEGVFKHLKRRDLMERLFKEKLQEIDNYKSILC